MVHKSLNVLHGTAIYWSVWHNIQCYNNCLEQHVMKNAPNQNIKIRYAVKDTKNSKNGSNEPQIPPRPWHSSDLQVVRPHPNNPSPPAPDQHNYNFHGSATTSNPCESLAGVEQKSTQTLSTPQATPRRGPPLPFQNIIFLLIVFGVGSRGAGHLADSIGSPTQ